MSSAIVVNALKKEAENKEQKLQVKAIGSSEVTTELKEDWDVVMVAPQIRHRFDRIKKEVEKAGIPCGVIPPQGYTPLGGPILFKVLKDLTT